MAKKHEPEVKQGLPSWMGTYGDLVTLLLCFFVLLFGMSTIDVSKYKLAISSFNNSIDVLKGGEALIGEADLITNGVSQLSELNIIIPEYIPMDEERNEDEEVGKTETSDITEYDGETKDMAYEIAEYLEQNNIDANINISYNADHVKLSLSGEALFDSGRADLKVSSLEYLEMISQVIFDNSYDEYPIQIEGHTDTVPMNTVQFPSNWYLSAARAIAVGTVFIDDYGFSPDMVSCTGYGEYKPIADNSTVEGRAENRRVEIKIQVANEVKELSDEITVSE